MKDFTFLTEEQIFGDDQLDILKKYGTKCAITDFSILLGGYVSGDYIKLDTTIGIPAIIHINNAPTKVILDKTVLI